MRLIPRPLETRAFRVFLLVVIGICLLVGDAGAQASSSLCVTARAGSPIRKASGWQSALQGSDIDYITCELGGAYPSWGYSFHNRNSKPFRVTFTKVLKSGNFVKHTIRLKPGEVSNDFNSADPLLRIISIALDGPTSQGGSCYNNSFGGTCSTAGESKPASVTPAPAAATERQAADNSTTTLDVNKTKPDPKSVSTDRTRAPTSNTSSGDPAAVVRGLVEADARHRAERREQLEAERRLEDARALRAERAAHEKAVLAAANGDRSNANATIDYFFRNGKYQEAIDLVNRILIRNPGIMNGYPYTLAAAHLGAGDTTSAVRVMQQFFEKSPESHADGLASLYISQGRFKEAIATYESSKESRKALNNPIHDNYGVALQLSGDRKRAEQWYEQILRQRWLNREIFEYNYAVYLIRRGKEKDGQKLLTNLARGSTGVAQYAERALQGGANPLLTNQFEVGDKYVPIDPTARTGKRPVEAERDREAGLVLRVMNTDKPVCSVETWNCNLAVQVLDAKGRSVQGAKVVWTLPAGGPHAYVAISDRSGVATATNLYAFREEREFIQYAAIAKGDTKPGHHPKGGVAVIDAPVQVVFRLVKVAH